MNKKQILFVFLILAIISPATSFAQSGKPTLFNKFFSHNDRKGIQPYEMGKKSLSGGDNMSLADRKKSKKASLDKQIESMDSNLGALANARIAAYQEDLEASAYQTIQKAKATAPVASAGKISTPSSSGKKIMVYDPEKVQQDTIRLFNPQ